MSFFDFFSPKAQPVEVYNAPPIVVNNHAEFVRNVHRLVNLYRAVSQEDTRQEIKDEIEVRKHFCLNFGHPIPYTLAEAEELQKKVTR